jgi:hypothetical protein
MGLIEVPHTVVPKIVIDPRRCKQSQFQTGTTISDKTLSGGAALLALR